MYPKLECHLAQEQEVQHETLLLFVRNVPEPCTEYEQRFCRPSVLSLTAAHERCTKNFPLCFLPQFKDLQFSDFLSYWLDCCRFLGCTGLTTLNFM